MRLTLRNMLAYIDGILEADSAEDIGKRIDESEQATNLMHRTRDVMRRLRLAAPSLTDRGPGLDANTVAEYLDHTLHDNRVTDFEKVCLDSDVHLAEVASCHQILALVLGEAAEIDPASRQRMYELPRLAAAEAEAQPASAAAEASSGDGEPAGEPAEQKPRRRPTVPDYLREPPKARKRRLLPVAITLVTVICLAVIALVVLGQFESGTPLGNAVAYLLRSGRSDAPGSGGPVKAPSGQPGTGPSKQPAAAPSEDSTTHPPQELGPESRQDPGIRPPEEPGTHPPEEPGPESPQGSGAQPPGEPVVVPLPKPPKGRGGLVSDKQILLRFDPEVARWQRVARQGIVTTGQKLLALPTYRPLLALMSAEVTVQLIDGTQAELLPTDAAGVPGLRVDYGRLIMHTVGKPQARVRIELRDRSGLITFVAADSAVALEVIPVHIPGTDPEADPGSLVADLYARGGQIMWDEGGARQTVRVPPDHWVMLSEQPTPAPAPVEEFPKWVTGGDMGALEKGADRLASATLERELQVDRSERLGARLVLMELNEHPRRENRWLAARCLGYIGDFGPLLAALSDADYPHVWTDESIEHLRAAVARSPQTAALVREALQRQYGEDASGLYRMLWGYTKEGLKDNRQAEELVDYLDHQTLAVRTLSFKNLRDIFGLGMMYLPTDTEATRRLSSRRWRQRLESGEIWSRLSGENGTAPVEKAPPPKGAEQEPY